MTDNLQEHVSEEPLETCDDPLCTLCETTRAVATAKKAEEQRAFLRRRKAFILTEEDLRTILDLPPDVVVRGMSYDWTRECIAIYTASDRFPEIPDGVEAPIADKTIECVRCDHGMLHVKWHVHDDEETE